MWFQAMSRFYTNGFHACASACLNISWAITNEVTFGQVNIESVRSLLEHSRLRFTTAAFDFVFFNLTVIPAVRVMWAKINGLNESTFLS
jgi:hypothetical protein